ncbi:MAG: flagella basal body P-ring formation protein FlgA [Bdellovibrionales bacterium]|nr:flagella basal body P-ring formation protein FlgA [Bdellovibrionales bacterium]
MKHLLSLLLFSSLNVSATECGIELYSKVYRLSAGQALMARDVIHNSNCSPEITNKLATIISSSEGSVGSGFLEQELQKDFSDIIINFPVKKLALLDLSTALKDQLLAGSNLFFTQARSLNNLSSLGLIEGEQLNAICDSCQTFGEKSIKIDISNVVSNTNRSLWFASKIMAKVKVVKASRTISFQQKGFDVKDFYYDEILTMSPDNVLTTLDNIQFYKPNKTIMQNAVISNLDVQAVNLVNYGTPASVVLTNHNISLQKMAMPIRSARLGEIVELKGPNNKNITGKVVDFNKVVIEL